MIKITILDAANYTVADVKAAVNKRLRLPSEELIIVSDREVKVDCEKLSKFVRVASWVFALHRPVRPQLSRPAVTANAADSTTATAATPETKSNTTDETTNHDTTATAPAPVATATATATLSTTPDTTQTATATTTADGAKFAVTFIFQAKVQTLEVDPALTAKEFIAKVVAPAYNVEDESRIGILLDGHLLPKHLKLETVTTSLRTAAIVPIVKDLISTRVRSQTLPNDAFFTDCNWCKNTNVDCKPK